MNDKTIPINSFEELQTKMGTMTFFASWTVTSDIGPGWIGSARTIEFQLGDCMLSETEFSKKLSDGLIKAISIPSESENHVINGQGDITIKEHQLEIDYDWDAAIPYQNPDKSGAGKVLFFP